MKRGGVSPRLWLSYGVRERPSGHSSDEILLITAVAVFIGADIQDKIEETRTPIQSGKQKSRELGVA